MKLYFAYGSNLDAKQMKSRCPASQALGKSQLVRYQLHFDGYSSRWKGGVATIAKNASTSVEGIVYRLTLADEQKLDNFEMHHYNKILVFLVNYGVVFTYIKPLLEPRAPSTLYLTKMLSGYMEYNLKISFLEKALKHCNYSNDNILLLQNLARKNILT